MTRRLLAKAPDARVTAVSRSGRNELRDSRLLNVIANASSSDDLAAALPEKPDCMFCLVGGLGGEDANVAPVRMMLDAAEKLDVPVIGCVGGTLGDKEFTAAKAKACGLVRKSGRRAVVLEPTLVYGAGRSDKLSKMVPLLKFAGIFNKKLRPVSEVTLGDVYRAVEPGGFSFRSSPLAEAVFPGGGGHVQESAAKVGSCSTRGTPRSSPSSTPARSRTCSRKTRGMRDR